MYEQLNKGVISKRTGKNTVALVGFSQVSRDLAPWDDKDTEIWTLNESYHTKWMKRFDRIFQIHTEENFNREGNPNDPEHPRWLRAKHPFPILMQEKYDYIPSAVRYPIEEVVAKYGNYQTSTLAFMLSLAMFEGFERIELYGFELGSMTEYHYQKAGAEYLIGMARGLGFEIYLPPQCSLCKGKMYGFESMDVVFRQRLEYRKNSIETNREHKGHEATLESGKLLVLEKLATERPNDEDIKKQYQEQFSKTTALVGEVNYILGSIAELNEVIALYDDHLIQLGVGQRQDFLTHTQESLNKTTNEEKVENG